MNRRLKGFLLTTSLILSTTLVGWADISTNVVNLIGDSEGLSFSDDSKYFFEMEDMTPGDSESKVIEIKNKYSESYKLYMKMKETNDKDFEDLLNKISLELTLDEESIYSGYIPKAEQLIEIGKVNPGDSLILEASVALDGPSIGNEYADKEGIVEWEFVATNLGSGNQDSNKPSKPNNNVDSSTSTNPPKTGDQGVVLYAVLGSICLIILGLRYMKIHKSR